MESIAKVVLKHLGNEHTKVERKEDFAGNYYSPLIDTIYIAGKFKNTKVPKRAENINKKAAELIVICHECIHSVQNKFVHMLNTIFSNIAIIMAAVCAFVGVFWTSQIWLKIITCIILLISIIVRLILEIQAVKGSVELAKKLVLNGEIDDVSSKDLDESVEYINKNKNIALTQMVLDKIVLLILVLVIK